MSTVDEIAFAIKGLSAKDREELLGRLADILPEMDGDAKWERIIRDPRPRPALEKLLDEVEAEREKHPERSRETSEEPLNPALSPLEREEHRRIRGGVQVTDPSVIRREP